MTEAGIVRLLEENLQLRQQLSFKDEQLSLKDEQLKRKDEQILELQRQIYGRRSEKRLPDLATAQLSLFDFNEGQATLEEEVQLKSVVEEITDKAEKRRKKAKESSLIEKRRYSIPSDIERREIIIEPDNLNMNTLMKIGEDISEQLMLDPAKYWVKRIVRPIYKRQEEEEKLYTRIIQAPAQPTIRSIYRHGLYHELPSCLPNIGNSFTKAW